MLNLDTLEEHMIYVEGGTFEMGGEVYGDEKPIHEVNLKDFHLCRYLVTQQLWEQVIRSNSAYFPHPLKPLENVSWYDSVNFCNKLSEKKNLEPYYEIFEDENDSYNKNKDDDQKWLVKVNPKANGYRLPSEAEWEYAARGGKFAIELTYAGSNNLQEVSWHDVGGGNSHKISQTVSFKRANALGIFDMSGNVREWCQDWYDEKYYQKCEDENIKDNPPGPSEGLRRVVRGGSWFSSFDGSFRPASRYSYNPNGRDITFGFRLSRY